jgi:MraZ protein
MFLGRYEHTVDSKGRVSIPMKFREVLTDQYEEKLIVTADLDQCLAVYPVSEWQRLQEKAQNLPTMQKEVRDWLRFSYSYATECPLDRQGRILLTTPLRDYARLNKAIVMLGLSKKIEIWDPKRLREKEAQLPKNFEKIGEALAGLGF